MCEAPERCNHSTSCGRLLDRAQAGTITHLHCPLTHPQPGDCSMACAELQSAAHLSGPAQAALVNRVASVLQDMGLASPGTSHTPPQQSAPSAPLRTAHMGYQYQGPASGPMPPTSRSPPPATPMRTYSPHPPASWPLPPAPRPSAPAMPHNQQQQPQHQQQPRAAYQPRPPRSPQQAPQPAGSQAALGWRSSLQAHRSVVQASKPPKAPGAAPPLPAQQPRPPQPPAQALTHQGGPSSWASPFKAAWNSLMSGQAANSPTPSPSDAVQQRPVHRQTPASQPAPSPLQPANAQQQQPVHRQPPATQPAPSPTQPGHAVQQQGQQQSVLKPSSASQPAFSPLPPKPSSPSAAPAPPQQARPPLPPPMQQPGSAPDAPSQPRQQAAIGPQNTLRPPSTASMNSTAPPRAPGLHSPPSAPQQGNAHHKQSPAHPRIVLPQEGLLQGQAQDYVSQRVLPAQNHVIQQQDGSAMGLRPPGQISPPLSQSAVLLPPTCHSVPGGTA